MLGQALGDYVRRPSTALDTARGAVTDVRSTANRMTGAVGDLLRAARSAAFPAPQSPLNSRSGPQRRVAVARADLDRIKRNQEHLLSLINDILNFAKVEAGKVQFERTEVSMNEALGELEALHPQRATETETAP